MRIPALLLLLLFAASPQANDTVLSRDAFDQQIRAVAERAALSRKSSPADAIRMRLQAPRGDAATEYLLRQDALEMSLPLQPEDAEVLHELAKRAPSVHVWHEEDGHARVPEIAVDAAAAARWMLQQSEVHALAERLRTSGPEYPSVNREQLAQAAKRLALDADTAELQETGNRLRALFNEGAPVEDALLTVALRAKDASLVIEVLESGEPSGIRRHLASLHDAFPGDQRVLLETAAQRPALAQHVIGLHGRHAREGWAWQFLNDSLANPELGASAAATLAKTADDAQLAQLAQRLHEPDAIARRIALALHLNGSSYAHQLLQEFIDTAPDRAFAREIGQWLHD